MPNPNKIINAYFIDNDKNIKSYFNYLIDLGSLNYFELLLTDIVIHFFRIMLNLHFKKLSKLCE